MMKLPESGREHAHVKTLLPNRPALLHGAGRSPLLYGGIRSIYECRQTGYSYRQKATCGQEFSRSEVSIRIARFFAFTAVLRKSSYNL